MDVRIYSVKAKNPAVNIWVYVMTTDTQLGASNMYGKLSRRPRVQEKALLGFRVHLCNTFRKANFEIHLPSKSCCNFS